MHNQVPLRILTIVEATPKQAVTVSKHDDEELGSFAGQWQQYRNPPLKEKGMCFCSYCFVVRPVRYIQVTSSYAHLPINFVSTHTRKQHLYCMTITTFPGLS